MTSGLDGNTLVVAIVGDPIAQVKSPAGLTTALQRRGANAVVVPAEVAAADFPAFLAGWRGMRNSPALIVTIPHKTAVLAACDHVTERAELAGSVNVVVKGPDGWHGENTDGAGFLDALAAATGCSVAGRRLLLAGAGGAGSAIAAAALARGAAQLAIHDIDTPRRDALIARLAAAYPGQVSAGTRDPTGFDIVANATPMGMRPGDPLPLAADRLVADQVAACVITRPEVSPFLQAARAAGCRTMTGSAMFEAQVSVLTEAILVAGGLAR